MTTQNEDVKRDHQLPGKKKADVLRSIAYVGREWWPELIAMQMSTMFLAAIFIVLGTINDKPLAAWHFVWGINPTTVISFLVSVCKIFLLAAIGESISQLKWVYFEGRARRLQDLLRFDSASRGEWGSLLFLLLVRWRAKAACLGAILILLALAYDPFAQQSLSFHEKLVPAEAGKAYIPWARTYDLGTAFYSPSTSFRTRQHGVPMNANKRTFYAPVLSSILSGLDGHSSPVNFTCSSTNCTWHEFETLGVCASCKDVSSSTKHECQYQQNFTPSEGAHRNTRCKYTMPSGAHLTSECIHFLRKSSSYTLWQSTTDWTARPDPPSIMTISALAFPPDDPTLLGCGQNLTFRMPPPSVTECTLRWCLKSFSPPAVMNGNLNESLSSSKDLVFPRTTCQRNNSVAGVYNVLTSPYSATSPPLFIAFPPDEIPQNLCRSNWTWYSDPAYFINVQDSQDIATLLHTIFETADTTGRPFSFAESLYTVNAGNLEADMHSIAYSLTNLIRSRGHISKGTAWTTKTYVRVHWHWLLYPCALIVLATLLLVITIILSAHEGRPVWKSTILALVFHGLGEDYKVGSLSTTSDMDLAARDLQVKLSSDDKGELNLTGATSSEDG